MNIWKEHIIGCLSQDQGQTLSAYRKRMDSMDLVEEAPVGGANSAEAQVRDLDHQGMAAQAQHREWRRSHR
jgi:hypothetical protein